MEKQFCININDSKELEIYFNQNQTLEYLLEYLAYNYPEEKICPCFQFIDNKNNKIFEKSQKVIDYLTNTNKIYLKNINDDKRCHCDESYKKYYYKTKLEIIRLLLKEIERLEEYVIEFKKITENLVEENKLLNNNIKMNSEISQIIKKDIPLNINIFDFYDTVVSIKSIGDICNGWEVKMNERLKNNYDKFKNEKNIKIGVIGNSNKGKSFLLSKISKSFLPSGSSIRTEGLSFKYPDLEKYKDKNIILIDSAGLETPVLQESKPFNNDIEKGEENIQNQKDNKNSREDFKEKSREKLITELFLQNYIINNSDILLIVVGILTYSEQKLINKIKALQKNNKKKLFIIHNLMTFTLKEQVEEYINEYLLKSVTFTLEEGNKTSTKANSIDGKYFYEKNVGQKIFHLIYANEGSEAGKYYNKFTLDYLENSYQDIIDIKPFDVIETIKNRFIDLSKEIIENLDKPLTIKDFNEDKLSIKLMNHNNITLKKCFIDELGVSNLKSNEFEPKYNYYKKDDKIIVKIEAPGNIGNINTSLKDSEGYKIIRVSGEKKKDKEPEDINDNLYSSREYGKFFVQCLFKYEDNYIIKNEKPKIYNKNGIIFLEFQIEEKMKEDEQALEIEEI